MVRNVLASTSMLALFACAGAHPPPERAHPPPERAQPRLERAQPTPEQAQPPPVATGDARQRRREHRCPADPPPGVPRFAESMTPPTLISGKEITHSAEALAAGVHGAALVSCVITVDGAVTGCRVRVSLPHMDEAIVEALQSRRYTPAQSGGKPLAVDYPFEVKLSLAESDQSAPATPAKRSPADTAKHAGSAAPSPPSKRNPDSQDVRPFGPGLTPPARISGLLPVYTKEARAACVEGLIVVRCSITTEGTLEDCSVIKSLPLMDESVMEAMKTHRYTPVTFEGKPVRVSYVFSINLRLN